jgi:hypothetical protein
MQPLLRVLYPFAEVGGCTIGGNTCQTCYTHDSGSSRIVHKILASGKRCILRSGSSYIARCLRRALLHRVTGAASPEP